MNTRKLTEDEMNKISHAAFSGCYIGCFGFIIRIVLIVAVACIVYHFIVKYW